jgi:hypothetical protein
MYPAMIAIAAATSVLDGLYDQLNPYAPHVARTGRPNRQHAILERLKVCFSVGAQSHGWLPEFDWLYRLSDRQLHLVSDAKVPGPGGRPVPLEASGIAAPGPRVRDALTEYIDTGQPFADGSGEWNIPPVDRRELERILQRLLCLAEADSYEWRRDEDIGDHDGDVMEHMNLIGLTQLEIDAADLGIPLPKDCGELTANARREWLARHVPERIG